MMKGIRERRRLRLATVFCPDTLTSTEKNVLKLRICINIISIGLKLITSKIISGIRILPDY